MYRVRDFDLQRALAQRAVLGIGNDQFILKVTKKAILTAAANDLRHDRIPSSVGSPTPSDQCSMGGKQHAFPA
jgi:hypothetical protein